jgi:hypothetical protein
MKLAFNALIDKGSCFVHYVIRKGEITHVHPHLPLCFMFFPKRN